MLLTAKASGPQGITLGSAADTSNFLQAVGFLSNATQPNQLSAGAAVAVGKDAHVQYVDNAGTPHDVYSTSNDLTNVVPGVDVKLQQAVDGTVVAPVTISVAQDSTALQGSIKTFVDAYNAVIDEINTATQAPVVGTTTDTSTGQTSGTQLTTGGVLFNNSDVTGLRDRLVSLVSSMGATGSTSYNSLASVGLAARLVVHRRRRRRRATRRTRPRRTASRSRRSKARAGGFSDLDVTKLGGRARRELQRGRAAVHREDERDRADRFVSDHACPACRRSSPAALAGTAPTTSLFASLSSQTNDQITSLQQQIKLVTDQANLQADRLRAEFVSSEGADRAAAIRTIVAGLAPRLDQDRIT